VIHSRARTVRTHKMLGDGEREFFAEGRAPCVVGFHGFTGTASELRPLLDRIAEAGFAVRVPLLPGHGDAPHELQGVSFDGWVTASRARVREAAERYGRVVLLGFSLGSLVAMQLATETIDGVVGLVVLGNALELTAFSSVPFAVVDRFGIQVPDWYLVKFRAADMRDRRAAQRIATYDRHPLRAALEVYRAGKRLRGEVARITCPTLIVHGARDLVCRPRAATWLRDHIGARDVTLRTYANSGHVVAADFDKEEVARDVIDFLRR
jgi:carboxylesterase